MILRKNQMAWTISQEKTAFAMQWEMLEGKQAPPPVPDTSSPHQNKPVILPAESQQEKRVLKKPKQM